MVCLLEERVAEDTENDGSESCNQNSAGRIGVVQKHSGKEWAYIDVQSFANIGSRHEETGCGRQENRLSAVSANVAN